MNPFEDENATYVVVINAENQYSLWPSFARIPEGWDATFGEAGRQECLEFIEKSWSDMRPQSLIDLMAAQDQQ